MIALFCYGSNGSKQLHHRIKRKIKGQKAKLLDHQVFFCGDSKNSKGATISVKKCKDKITKGSIVYVSQKELREIDKFEGCNSSDFNNRHSEVNVYYRKMIKCMVNSKEIKAFIYIKNDKRWIVDPSEEYLKKIYDHLNEYWLIKKIVIRDYKNNVKGTYDGHSILIES